MSILNKVLKDLDKRGQKPGEAERSGGSAVAGPSSRLPWMIAIAAVVLLVVALIAGYVSWTYWAGDSRSLDAKSDEKSQPRLVQQAPSSQKSDFVRPATMTEPQPKTSDGSTQQKANLKPEPQPASVEAKPVKEADTATQTVSEPNPQMEAQTEVDPEPEPASEPTLVKKSVQLSPQQLIEREITAAHETAEKGLLSESAKHWQRVLSIDPNHIEARRQLAALQFGRNRWQDALQVLTAGLELNPKAHELRLLAAKMLQKREQPQLALTLLQQAQPQVSDHLEYYRLKAQLAQQLNQWGVMAQSYKALTEAQPTQGRWWLGQAIAQQQLGETENAEDAFKRARKLIQHAPTLDFIEQQLNLLVEQDEATSS
jgi:MSHA biogenesis protein MshN